MLACLPVVAVADALPWRGLSWKNLAVGDRRTAVYSMHRDSTGMMWVGSGSGLFFYDGVNLHPVGRPQTDGSHIYAIVQQGSTLWLGTNNGLCRYDLSTDRCTHVPDTPSEIRSLQVRRDGTLVIGTLSGIYTRSRDGRIANISDGLPDRAVYSMLPDRRGQLYAGTRAGLAVFDASRQRFRPVPITMPDGRCWNGFANCLLESNINGNLLIGGDSLLLHYNPASGRCVQAQSCDGNNIKSMTQKADGTMMVGTDNGVYIWRDGKIVNRYRHDTRRPLSPADNEIWCIFYDTDHRLWLGHERGISIASYSPALRTVILGDLTDSGEGCDIYNIFRDSRRNLWLTGTGGAIMLGDDGAVRQFRHDKSGVSLAHNRVRAIFEDSSHRLWLGSDGGLSLFNPNSSTFTSYIPTDPKGNFAGQWMYALGASDADGLWTGSFLGGIHRIEYATLNPQGGKVVSSRAFNSLTKLADRRPAFSNDQVNNMLIDGRGQMWVLLFRDGILSRINLHTNGVHRYDIPKLTGSFPSQIARDPSGRIWCAFDGGAVCFEHDGSTRVIRFAATGADETILAMSATPTAMWVSTQSNLWAVDYKTLRAERLPIPPRAYTAIYHDSVSGHILLGSSDMLTYVQPDVLHRLGTTHRLRLLLRSDSTNCLLPNSIFDNGRTVRLPYRGTLSLTIATDDYSPESNRRYMYRLLDSRADSTTGWMTLPDGASTLNLTDLTMGDYTLEVRAAGSTAAPTRLRLKVSPPIALQWWAIVCYILLAALLLWGAWRLLRRRHLHQLQDQERRQAVDEAQRRLTLLSETASHLKAPLDQLIAPVEQLRAEVDDADLRRKLDRLHERTVRLSSGIIEHLIGQHDRLADELRDSRVAHAHEQTVEVESLDDRQLAIIARAIEDNLGDATLNVSRLSELTGINGKQLYRLVKKHLDLTPVDYIRRVRLQRAAALLQHRSFTVSEVSYMTGFNSPSYFAKCFQAHYGCRPSEYTV